MGPGFPHGSSPWAEGPRDDDRNTCRPHPDPDFFKRSKTGIQDPKASSPALDPSLRGADEKRSRRLNIRWDQAKVLTKPSKNSPRPFSTSGEISPVSRIA